jgi:predicted nucleotide-binding protein (sugar kinase/HSP70/actin superfamily)
MCTFILQHYHTVLLPFFFALDAKTRHELAEAITEIDYLIETLSLSELSKIEKEETELAYWAWWEKIRNKIPS